MMRRFAAAISVLALAACAQDASEPSAEAAAANEAAPVALEVTEVAAGLAFPWGIDFLPNGDMLVTERDGRLRLIAGGELRAEPVGGVPAAFVDSQGGLLDVALHPNFAENQLVYLSYSAGTDAANRTTLARGRFDGAALQDVEVIFEAAQPGKQGGLHFGGRILWLPDGTLLLGVGDGYGQMKQAQTLDNHFGKIVRLTEDGAAAADNPYAGQAGALPEIYTLGHRNPQGLALDPASGRIYQAEFGPMGGDELNLLEPKVNYGWPEITYGVDYSGAVISPFTEKEGLAQPLAHWTPSISPSGILFYTGDLFPAWKGDVLMANLSSTHLRRVDLEDGRVQGQQEYLKDRGERLRDIAQGPDGAIYVTTDDANGKVLRIAPQA